MLWLAVPRKGYIGMVVRKCIVPVLFIVLVLGAGCSLAGKGGMLAPQSAGLTPVSTETMIPSATAANPAAAGVPATSYPALAQPSKTPTQTVSLPNPITPVPTETEVAFGVGRDLTIDYLRGLRSPVVRYLSRVSSLPAQTITSILPAISRKATRSMAC